MGQHSDRARQAILNSAEELFALHGLDAVSNRRIAEHAGNSNHSAVSYHFGGRDELVQALINRYVEPALNRRQEMVAALGDTPTLHDLTACSVLPWMESVSQSGTTPYTSRFIVQLRAVPSALKLVLKSFRPDSELLELFDSARAELAHVPSQAIKARAMMMQYMIFSVCAEYEGLIERGRIKEDWSGIGYFLVDSIVGMLAAPVSQPERIKDFPEFQILI